MSNVILIGMPGAGKSTLGIQLAKETARDFIDTDVLIQLRERKTLQGIIDETDYLNLRKIEEEILLSLDCDHYVIATGGSVVYSEKGMKLLQGIGVIVFLDASLVELRQRIDNYESRGITKRSEQTFEELYTERKKLYEQYADITFDCNGKDQNSLLVEMVLRLKP